MEALLLAIATICQVNVYSVGYFEPRNIQNTQRDCASQLLSCIDNSTDKREIASCLDPHRIVKIRATKCNDGCEVRWGCKCEGCCD